VIFWISLAIAIVLMVVVKLADESIFTAFWVGVITSGFIFLIAACITGAALGVERTETKYVTPLKALATSSKISGSFFLGSGYVEGKRTLNYITADGDRNYIRQQDASASVVIEDITTGQPHMLALEQCYDSGWIMPWKMCKDINEGVAYEFHVPAGSVLSDYTVDNK
jgi:hypothetical protein